MRLHGNARTCPHSRRLAVRRLEQGWTLARAAEAAGVSVRTISKWRRRYRREGEQGLLDRSSAPAWIPHRTPEERVQAIEWSIALGAGAAWVSTGLGLQRIAVGSAGAMLVSPRNNSLAVYSGGHVWFLGCWGCRRASLRTIDTSDGREIEPQVPVSP